MNGDIHGRDGRVAKVGIGPFELHDVTVITAPTSLRSRHEGRADAIVANGLLRRFNLIFDYAHRKLYLKPNRSFSEPFAPTGG